MPDPHGALPTCADQASDRPIIEDACFARESKKAEEATRTQEAQRLCCARGGTLTTRPVSRRRRERWWPGP
eukprot:13412318-Heterocapsa_arctica.AAC.1